MPQVSVIIPAWNAENFIQGALDSALKQTLADIEVLVIDDASSDGTASLVAAMASADPRLRLMRLTQNGGPSKARNRALEVAKGDYIAVLDADDRFAPARLQNLLEFAQAHGADIVFDNLLRCPLADSDAGGEPHLRAPENGAAQRVDLEMFLAANRMNGSDRTMGHLKPMISRSFLESRQLRYCEDVRIAEDFLLICEALAQGAQAWLTYACGYKYWIRPGSLSKRPMARDVEAMRASDDRFRARFGLALQPREKRALDARRADLDSMAAYLTCREALLGGEYVRGMAAIAAHPSALKHARPFLAQAKRAALRQLRQAFQSGKSAG